MQQATIRLLRNAGFVSFLLASVVGHAQKPKIPPKYKAAPLYVAQLPKFCWQQYVDASLTRPPFAIVSCGGGMNHFCPALVYLMEAQNPSLPRHERIGAVKNAVNEVNYTLREMTSNCPIATDVYAAKEKARVLSTIIK